MAGAASVDIVVKVFDQASKALKDIAKANGDLGKGSKSTAEQLKGLGKAALGVTAAVAAFGVAAKAAFEIGKQGAAIKQTGESFGFLLSKIGASADTLDQLRAASRGTISDMALMSSTATLLAGAQGALGERLAQATPQLLNIAKAAQKLNPSLGDTTFLYNSLAVGIKRGSPLILDNLGLLVSQGDANRALAKELGKTVAALTTEEMKMALLNETIRAGNVLVAQAGGTTESATDAYGVLEAEIANLTDTLKVNVHRGVKPYVETVGKAVTATHEWVKSLQTTEEELKIQAEMTRQFGDAVDVWSGTTANAIGVGEHYNKIMAHRHILANQTLLLLDEEDAKQRQHNLRYKTLTQLLVEANEAVEKLTLSEEQELTLQGMIQEDLGKSTQSIEFYKNALVTAEQAVLDAGEQHGIFSKEVDLARQHLQGVSRQLNLAKDKFKEVGSTALITAQKAIRPYTISILESKAALGLAMDGMDDYMGLIRGGLMPSMSGMINVTDFLSGALGELEALYNSASPSTDNYTVSTIQSTIATEELKQSQSGLQSSLVSTASGYDKVAKSARAALAAQGATIVEGVGIVSAKGDLRAAKIGEEWEEVHGEWRSGAGGRKEKEHIADVIKDMQQRHGFDPANPQQWGLDFLASQAGGGGAAFTRPELIEDALKGAAVGAQHGANFIVPQGFQNDNFLMGVSSGERVSVTPAHSTRAGGGMVIQNLNVYGVQTDSELFEAVVRAARQRGRDFARVM